MKVSCNLITCVRGHVTCEFVFDHSDQIRKFSSKWAIDFRHTHQCFGGDGTPVDETLPRTVRTKQLNQRIIDCWDMVEEYTSRLYRSEQTLPAAMDLMHDVKTLVTHDHREATDFILEYLQTESALGFDTEFIHNRLCVVQIASLTASLAFFVPTTGRLPASMINLITDPDILKIAIDPKCDIRLIEPYIPKNVKFEIMDVCSPFTKQYGLTRWPGAVRVMRIVGYDHSKEDRWQRWGIPEFDNKRKWDYALLDPILALRAYHFIETDTDTNFK